MAAKTAAVKGKLLPVKKLEKVSAFPSKSFFVDMLTRDIELKDAILDLLDNCLDGILREIDEKKKQVKLSTSPYAGYWANIEFDREMFRISDNCGGISREILEKYAFRLGRPSIERDKNLKTVGMYGIGMKRAIFKMGRSCTVITKHGESAYKIKIPPAWLKDDDSAEAWSLKVEGVNTKGLIDGTTIEIRDLIEDIAEEFDTKTRSDFLDEFTKEVEANFSYIIHKGFVVKINGKPVKPRKLQFKLTENRKSNKKIDPYLYIGKIEGVDVRVAVGFYRPIPGETEVEAINLGKEKNKSEDAGWTVICNDRVVLYNDKTHLTGWGEAGVPKYHSQFIAIAGIVTFETTNSMLLPVTTTKRGINLNSSLYATVRNIMREGLKHFTDFTNKWKNDPESRKSLFRGTDSIEAIEVFDKFRNSKSWITVRTEMGGKKYKPELPVPPKENAGVVVKYTRPLPEIERVSRFLFRGSSDENPSKVGEECFMRFLAQSKEDVD